MLFSDSTHFCYTLTLISTTPLVKMHLEQPCGCVAMKAPVGPSSRRAICVSRWKGFALTSVGAATNAKNKNQIPLNMPRVQRRRPLPAAEAGRSCWDRGQQDTNAVQGMKWMLGAATLGGIQNRLTNVDMPHRHDLPLVVVRLCRQAHGQRHRADTAHEHDQHIQDLCTPVQLLVTPTERPTVPKAEQDSKIASMTDTASEVL